MPNSKATDRPASDSVNVHPTQEDLEKACGKPGLAGCHDRDRIDVLDNVTDHTIAHELIHRNSSGDFKKALGKDLNEGVTDRFASQISGVTLGDTHKYANQRRIADALARDLDEETLMKAYFQGDKDAIARIRKAIPKDTLIAF